MRFSKHNDTQSMSKKSQPTALRAVALPKQTSVKLAANQMHCPCCGNAKLIEIKHCEACGARPIADGMARPVTVLPALGPAMKAFGLVLFLIVGFVTFWLIGNEMKVGRAVLVNLFGDSLAFTKTLLQGDDHLGRYRIFSFDAYRQAINFSLLVAPLALWAMRMAWRAAHQAKALPMQFGGLRMAQVSFALAALLFVTFTTAGLSGIPMMIQRGRDRHSAATRAVMYEQAAALRLFNRENGTYPQESAELKDASLPRGDYWENEFKYEPFGTVASTATGNVGFSSYTLRSAGPDGTLGNGDDLVMIDGVIVDRPAETDLPPSLLAPEKPRK